MDDLQKQVEQIAIDYFTSFNKATEGRELQPLQVADLMHAIVGTILATYVTNYVAHGLRDYIAAKMMYSLTANLKGHIETLVDTNTTTESLDSKEPV